MSAVHVQVNQSDKHRSDLRGQINVRQESIAVDTGIDIHTSTTTTANVTPTTSWPLCTMAVFMAYTRKEFRTSMAHDVMSNNPVWHKTRKPYGPATRGCPLYERHMRNTNTEQTNDFTKPFQVGSQ